MLRNKTNKPQADHWALNCALLLTQDKNLIVLSCYVINCTKKIKLQYGSIELHYF